MNKKYVVVYIIPDYVEKVIRAAYERVTGRELITKNLHISLIYSFYLAEGYGEEWLKKTVLDINFEEISSWISEVGLFTQKDKKILHMQVEPKDAFVSLHKRLMQTLREGIIYDINPFDGGELPIYTPHISIDYGFDGDSYVLEALGQENIKAYFDVSNLSIIRFDENEFLKIN